MEDGVLASCASVLYSKNLVPAPSMTRICSSILSLLAFWPATSVVSGYSHPPRLAVDRRTVVATTTTGTAATLLLGSTCTTPPAWAADGVKPTEFQSVGRQAPVPDGQAPFETLSNGVQIKDYRLGSGDAAVRDGSKVAVQLTGRLLNLNGVVFYDSKRNDPDGFGQGLPVSFTIGAGQAIPGLEAGLLGMKKGGIRRIIVPPELGYKPKDGPLLEPVPFQAIDQRALDSVIQNPRRDATLLFDCKLERIK